MVGAALVTHLLVDAASFTGSGETGRRIQAAAAPTLKRLSMELGGKSPLMVFDDADIDAAAAAITGAAWRHSGQLAETVISQTVVFATRQALAGQAVAIEPQRYDGALFQPFVLD